MQYESTCDATVGRPCGECVVVARNRLNTLARNLAVAAFGCAAYDLGDWSPVTANMRVVACPTCNALPGERCLSIHGYRTLSAHARRIEAARWSPGCGRTAPGWTREEGR